MNKRVDWLLSCGEPWTRYRTLIDLLDQPETSREVSNSRQAMLDHPSMLGMMEAASGWQGYALKRHNDASHPIYKISTLAEFGLTIDDPLLGQVTQSILGRQSSEGAFKTLLFIPKAFGGTDQEEWAWILCDFPTLLYSLQILGLSDEPRVEEAVNFLISLVQENGWRCTASPILGKFKGPGRRTDPCPIANLLALKVLSQCPDHLDSPATRIGTEMILNHWRVREEKKYFLFAMGTDFKKLKYPFIWYDILHVVDVLSRFPFVHTDQRFKDMMSVITSQSDVLGRYTAKSMYRAWNGWSFADKKVPSPWLTFLVLRILKRTGLEIH